MRKGKKMKLTMVSIWYRGVTHTKFVMLKPCSDGKFRFDLEQIFPEINIYPGTTFSVG